MKGPLLVWGIPFVILFALVLWPMPASAQQPPRDPRPPVEPDEESRDRLGADAQAIFSADLRIGPLLMQPQIGVAGGWQTVANRRNREDPSKLESDFNLSLTPAIRVALPMGGDRHVVSISPSADYDWFAKFESLRTFNFVVPVRYTFNSTRMRAGLGYTWVDGEQGRFDPILAADREGEVVPEFELDQRTSYIQNSVNGNFDFNIGSRINVGFTAGWQRADFGGGEAVDGFDLNDRDRQLVSYGTSFGYVLGPSASLTFNYERTDDRPEDPESFRARTRDEYGMNLNFNPNPTFSSNLQVGRQVYDHEAEGRPGSDGLTFSGGMSVQPSGWFRFQLSGSRGVQPSFWENNTHFDRTSASGAVQFGIGNALELGTRAGYSTMDWPLEATVMQLDGSLLTAKRKDETLQYSVTVGWRVTPRNAIRLEVGQFERRSNFDTRTLDGLLLRAGYSLVY